MIIGVDFDNTAFYTGKLWERWYKGLVGVDKVPLKNADYDISTYYKDEIEDSAGALGKDFFFDRKDLYDKQRIFFAKDAMYALSQISKMGHKVWIISDCSPINYIAKYIPSKKLLYADRIIRSADKGKYNVDIMIDDRHEYLNQFADKPETILIKYDCKYKQNVPLVRDDVITTTSWLRIRDIIMKESAKRKEDL